MSAVASLVIYGAVIGGIWALVAAGFSLIFGVMRVLNFGHGAIFISAAYATVAFAAFGMHFAFVASLVVGMAVGIAIYFLIKPVRKKEITAVIVTLAFALLIQHLLLLIFGNRGLTVQPVVEGLIEVFGAKFATIRVVTLFTAVLVLLALEMVMRTSFGKQITAVSEDSDAAMLLGIDVERIYLLVILISSILAAIAGYFYVQVFSVNPELGLKVLIYAFAIVILGGLGSIKGSVISSFILGYIIAATILFLSPRWSELVMLLAIVVTLIIRPYGIFGVKE